MAICLCCQRDNANIRVEASVIFHICGQSDCKTEKGQTVGDWLVDERFFFIEDEHYFTLVINNKSYDIPVDKRVVRGLRNKIIEIMVKEPKKEEVKE